MSPEKLKLIGRGFKSILTFFTNDSELLYIAIATCIRTNQNPNSVRWRFAPPHTIWVLCPNKNGDSYIIKAIPEF
jgi:hypothetical protein